MNDNRYIPVIIPPEPESITKALIFAVYDRQREMIVQIGFQSYENAERDARKRNERSATNEGFIS